ncbi:MAG: hypothetical protein ACI92N_002795 [Pseudomonadales bacterium]|jgi:hypothetical protein
MIFVIKVLRPLWELDSRSQRNVIHWKIALFTPMLFDLRIKILRFDVGAGLSHRLNLPYDLVEIIHAEAYPTPLVRGFGSLQRIGTRARARVPGRFCSFGTNKSLGFNDRAKLKSVIMSV